MIEFVLKNAFVTKVTVYEGEKDNTVYITVVDSESYYSPVKTLRYKYAKGLETDLKERCVYDFYGTIDWSSKNGKVYPKVKVYEEVHNG